MMFKDISRYGMELVGTRDKNCLGEGRAREAELLKSFGDQKTKTESQMSDTEVLTLLDFAFLFLFGSNYALVFPS